MVNDAEQALPSGGQTDFGSDAPRAHNARLSSIVSAHCKTQPPSFSENASLVRQAQQLSQRVAVGTASSTSTVVFQSSPPSSDEELARPRRRAALHPSPHLGSLQQNGSLIAVLCFTLLLSMGRLWYHQQPTNNLAASSQPISSDRQPHRRAVLQRSLEMLTTPEQERPSGRQGRFRICLPAGHTCPAVFDCIHEHSPALGKELARPRCRVVLRLRQLPLQPHRRTRQQIGSSQPHRRAVLFASVTELLHRITNAATALIPYALTSVDTAQQLASAPDHAATATTLQRC